MNMDLRETCNPNVYSHKFDESLEEALRAAEEEYIRWWKTQTAGKKLSNLKGMDVDALDLVLGADVDTLDAETEQTVPRRLTTAQELASAEVGGIPGKMPAWPPPAGYTKLFTDGSKLPRFYQRRPEQEEWPEGLRGCVASVNEDEKEFDCRLLRFAIPSDFDHIHFYSHKNPGSGPMTGVPGSGQQSYDAIVSTMRILMNRGIVPDMEKAKYGWYVPMNPMNPNHQDYKKGETDAYPNWPVDAMGRVMPSKNPKMQAAFPGMRDGWHRVTFHDEVFHIDTRWSLLHFMVGNFRGLPGLGPAP